MQVCQTITATDILEHVWMDFVHHIEESKIFLFYSTYWLFYDLVARTRDRFYKIDFIVKLLYLHLWINVL